MRALASLALLLLVACEPEKPVDTDETEPTDLDGDGYDGDADCDDGSAAIHPGAVETCDGVDGDCDGEIDEEAEDAATFYVDGDADGYGDDAQTVQACDAPAGTASVGGDCDDADGAWHPGADESDCTDPADYNCDGSVGYADADADGWAACEDCDDAAADVRPDATEACNTVDDDCDGAVDEAGAVGETTWYEDGDGDGHGDLDRPALACDAPASHVAVADDCDDAEPAIHPGADESDCTDPTDYNCDGSTGYADADGDGQAACAECDDTDGTVFPGAEEACDGVDEDCDGLVDEAGSAGEGTWYADADGDGFGDPATTASACGASPGWVADATDCDDTDATLNPDTVWHRDVDGDGRGGSLTTVTACAAPAGYARTADDCDDYEASVFPGATEVCDAENVDEDCDALADDADTGVSSASTSTWYRDTDRDGFGGTTSLRLCDAPTGYVATAGDCNDAAATVSPAATEVCDAANVDEDCDGAVEDADASVSTATKGTFYRDADADTYGSATRTTSACDTPSGYVTNANDCDDAAAGVNPGAAEVCDASNVDEDCDGAVDDDDASVSTSTRSTFYRDADVDGYGASTVSVSQCDSPAGYVTVAGDCNDAAATVKPGGAEVCDAANADEDCDGLADDADTSVSATGKRTLYADTDRDGFGDASFTGARCDTSAAWVADATDCDDARAAVNPGVANETCATPYDDDCDSVTNERNATACVTWHLDADDDTYGATASQCWCEASGDYTADDDDDCDDADASIKPGASEVCNGEDDDCDGLVDDADPIAVTTTWYADADEDGYGDPDEAFGACAEPEGYVEDATDCDDGDIDVNPGAVELYGDAIDDDCDGDTTPRDYDSCTGYQVPGDYATLASALAALEDSTATICLAEGTHTGSFTFDGYGNVTVQGKGRGRTTLSGGPTINANTGGSFTLQGMSIVGQLSIYEFAAVRQHVYLYDLEIDSTTNGLVVGRTRRGYTWVWADGLDIDAASSYAGVEIVDSNTTDYGRDFQVVLYNTYIHDSGTCVLVDNRGTHPSQVYLEDSTLVGCGTGARLNNPYDGEVTFYINNTVFYGNTTAMYDNGSGYGGWITARYNALYANTANYAGRSSAGEGFVTSDPMLDFSYAPPRPMEGSPLIDAGGMWLGPTSDYWGSPRSWPPDIGAIELE